MTTNIVPLKAGGPILGIVPQNIDEIFRLATGIAKSGLAPKDMGTPEKVMVAIMTGLEIGLPPMFAIQKIAVINGRPSLWGDAIPALLLSRGFKLREWMDGDDEARVAYCEIKRPDGDTTAKTFGVKDARKAGLWGKSGPWSQYPDRMLQMRARGFAARDGAADVLGGLYLREELDEPMRDVTPEPLALDLPDIPDPAEDSEKETTPEIEPIADVKGLLAKIAEDRAFCESEQDVADLRDQYDELLSRLCPNDRARANSILSIEE